MDELANKLLNLRKEKGISRKKLSNEIGYGTSIIYYWEKGIKEPSTEAIKTLCKYYKISADYLLGLTDI